MYGMLPESDGWSEIISFLTFKCKNKLIPLCEDNSPSTWMADQEWCSAQHAEENLHAREMSLMEEFMDMKTAAWFLPTTFEFFHDHYCQQTCYFHA